MKPDCPVARRSDYRFDHAAPHEQCASMVRDWHYAKGCANTSTVRTAMLRGDQAVGAALWMPPTANAAQGMAKRHLGDAMWHREVIVLSRLVVGPDEPQNAASMLLGASTREVLTNKRWRLLLTYADEGEGHKGTIYLATGWVFDGKTTPESRWRLNGTLISRLATKSRTVADMVAMGAVRTISRKLRFVKVRRPA